MIPDSGNRRTLLQIENLKDLSQEAIRKAFYMIGKDLVDDSRAMIMEKPKHGRLYKLRKNGRLINHRASAPGEAPANFTGALKHSLDFTVSGSEKMVFGSRTTFPNRKGTPAGVNYGGYLELGTRKIEPRPYLEPAIKKNYGNIQDHFEQQLKKSLLKK